MKVERNIEITKVNILLNSVEAFNVHIALSKVLSIKSLDPSLRKVIKRLDLELTTKLFSK